MGSQHVSVEYLSAGANRQTAVADWSRSGLLAFGADTNIALWAPKEDKQRGILVLLRGHGDVVKAVTFLPEEDGDQASYLVSGANDKSLIIWKSTPNQTKFGILHTSHDHAGAINCIAAIRLASDPARWLVASGAADATIHIWSFASDKLELLQSVKTTPKFFPLALSLSWLGDDRDALVLAAAGTKDTIQILTAETAADPIQFQSQASLRGHEGWIRSLSFARESSRPGSDLLLASASQDKYVRIWRFHQGRELPAATADGADPSGGAYMPGKSPSNKAHWIKAAGSKDFSVTFEALLLGHEDWIYSARWNASADGTLRLLSTSADNSLAIWEADSTSGIWVSTVRLGEISREKGATTATGSTGGFWTGLWSPDGRSVACLGRTGSWRRWERSDDPDDDVWRPCVAVSGHTKAVTGIAWSRDGAYLLSTSLDQTTRLHARWTAGGGAAGTWHEMSRPQIHGYDLNCIDSISATQFVSGADEKLMRVFSEPRAVAALLHRLGGIGSAEDGAAAMPDAASMPVLGLSNKAVDAVDDAAEAQPIDDRDREAMDPASIVKKSQLDPAAEEDVRPPTEDVLSRGTLWPEVEKLYGHGYELSCLAASHDRRLVASACRASSVNHAVIRLFETAPRWTEVRPPLAAHSLTATRLRFAPDDAHLLSVGRDRQWAVFQRTSGETPGYELLQANPKGHARMILDCAWAPRGTAPLFATAGRDKQIRLWRGEATNAEGKPLTFAQAAALSIGVPVTAVDFLPRRAADGRCLLAFGTEDGRVGTYLVSADGAKAEERPLPTDMHLPKAVAQLAWRPSQEKESGGTDVAELAVAGEDSSLRVYAFKDGFWKTT
ncbi:RNA polymerase II Elongator subunit [Cordyceps fumosorosea ARSEF 2679]|uniref:Elongator complex protein 2 n=1 Tax=Cordyceps fumosorosea (strain ARSEF 2679) TaxID=1081104 RepID=A0A167MCQ6_CORFA|nr:RNA polymerase II Elongator subunit [Cordyceps fumosorosea ARSEF 2679]OAA54207.1 RNA polymerase II Elongator subunit [Cordyceps fumosorosea ARSEF 2679]